MRSKRCGALIVCVAWALLAGSVPSPASAASPPQGKTYFTIFVGLDSPYSWEAGCLRFTATTMCAAESLWGTWAYTQGPASEAGIEFEIADDRGERIRIDGRGRIDDRGKGDSLGGVARTRVGGKRFNFSFTGRSTKRNKCARLLREWEGAGADQRGAWR